MKALVLSILCFMLINANEVQAYFTMTGTIKNLPAALTVKNTYADTAELCINSTGDCYAANISDREMRIDKPYKYIRLEIETDYDTIEHTFYPDEDSIKEYLRQWNIDTEYGIY
mgnify:CR=1 FL=1